MSPGFSRAPSTASPGLSDQSDQSDQFDQSDMSDSSDQSDSSDNFHFCFSKKKAKSDNICKYFANFAPKMSCHS